MLASYDTAAEAERLVQCRGEGLCVGNKEPVGDIKGEIKENAILFILRGGKVKAGVASACSAAAAAPAGCLKRGPPRAHHVTLLPWRSGRRAIGGLPVSGGGRNSSFFFSPPSSHLL